MWFYFFTDRPLFTTKFKSHNDTVKKCPAVSISPWKSWLWANSLSSGLQNWDLPIILFKVSSRKCNRRSINLIWPVHSCNCYSHLHHRYFHPAQPSSRPSDRALCNLKNLTDESRSTQGNSHCSLAFWRSESERWLSLTEKNFSCRNMKKGALERLEREGVKRMEAEFTVTELQDGWIFLEEYFTLFKIL